ncbi:MAG: D-glycerate dehydrogenase [Chitinophagaceae bacterium]|nr:MAG: D-glycerate dehydrogenase [Chitinophagaceae bacterium]
MKIFVTRVLPEAGLGLLREAGHTLTVYSGKRELTPEELIAECLKHEALLSAGHNKLDAAFFRSCGHLKVVALYSVGYDHVDLKAAASAGVPVSNTPDVLSAATADTAFLLLLSVSRKAFYLHKQIAAGKWGFYDPTSNLGVELTGKTLGVFGLGAIGLELAKRCQGAYGMKVIYHNRNINPVAEQQLGARYVSFDELLEQSDVLSVHATLTAQTRGLFNKEVFGKMKPSSIFINTGRGGLHNEADLLQALLDKQIWGAGLDVTNPEPMDPGNPLLDLPNVAVLPHIGSATVEARDAMARVAAMNLLAAAEGRELPNPVSL